MLHRENRFLHSAFNIIAMLLFCSGVGYFDVSWRIPACNQHLDYENTALCLYSQHAQNSRQLFIRLLGEQASWKLNFGLLHRNCTNRDDCADFVHLLNLSGTQFNVAVVMWTCPKRGALLPGWCCSLSQVRLLLKCRSKQLTPLEVSLHLSCRCQLKEKAPALNSISGMFLLPLCFSF